MSMEDTEVAQMGADESRSSESAGNGKGTSNMDHPPLHVLSLYHRDMNIYGDSGNILSVTRRAELYGFRPMIRYYNPGDPWPDQVDVILGGGGQDHGQERIIQDLQKRGSLLADLADRGTPMLMICGLYQLFGHYFETSDHERLEGIGILDVHTVARSDRMIGNLVEHSPDFGQVVGYENHSGLTYLGEGAQPLGTVDQEGRGNNGKDHTEGARRNKVIGTYMHGSLLPKNPAITDYLIGAAADGRYGEGSLDQMKQAMTEDASQELARLDSLAEQASRIAVSRPR
ncbi:Cobyric acid synthase, glutamine amidotransferase [Bifidobacterium coryneforme]|uniref:Lipid II isoglutaminyl synthase (glutamine-hydrolyzing) subunit GatD n=2 Tax=Bifidobacterium coryneforme TaxID=1687 RepID=A0ABD4ACX1_9BIFI|nr:Cobyric acid synthase, glutamine amidotransferase [Bifidobacterium coryneforme]